MNTVVCLPAIVSGSPCPDFQGANPSGIDPTTVLSLFSQILDGVEAAHLRGVVHRDLKPENVLYRKKGELLAVADFGVARFIPEEQLTAVETKPSTRLANFQYAAPEQRERGVVANVPADIYALGLMLNEMFTKRLAHGTGYRTIGETVPEFGWLDEIVGTMLRQNPAERPSSIDDLKRDIAFHQQDVVSRQKISRLDKTVVKESDIDDPIVAYGVSVVDADWNAGTLNLRLSQPVNAEWHRALCNMGNYSSILGKGPEMFNVRGDMASIAAREEQLGDVIEHFKRWLPQATRVYENDLRNDIARAAAEERESLKKQRAREEQQLRVSQKLRGILGRK